MITTTTHTTQVAGITLEERHTTVRVGIGQGAVGAAYRRPGTITHADGAASVPDLVLRARLVALLAVVCALAVRRFMS